MDRGREGERREGIESTGAKTARVRTERIKKGEKQENNGSKEKDEINQG